MSYVSLYRKWRPKDFTEVKGQDAIVKTLKTQVETGKISHAYLFTGTRGTGKTSVAKILAAAVNCEDPIEGNPCLKCKTCQSIISGSNFSIREIDAASNNGVDNVREIREDVMYPPSDAKYKVYIIDETHMLSTGAFNALLKTIEEPPEYVIFILATTESAKIPVTILSRCQRYDFHRIPVKTIENQLKELAEKENIKIEDKAIHYIAKKADGAMRDALSILDRCASLVEDEGLKYDDVLKSLGTVNTEVFSNLFNLLLSKDAVGIIETLDNAMNEGTVLSTFISDFIVYLRNVLILSIADKEDANDILDATSEDMDKMTEDAGKTDSEQMSRYIRVLSELLNRLRNTESKKTLTEITLIGLTKDESDNTITRSDNKPSGSVEKMPGPTDIPHRAEEAKAPHSGMSVNNDYKKTEEKIKDLEMKLAYAMKRIDEIVKNPGCIGEDKGWEEDNKSFDPIYYEPKNPVEAGKMPEVSGIIKKFWKEIITKLEKEEGSSTSVLEDATVKLSENGQILQIMIKSSTVFKLINKEILCSLENIFQEYSNGYDIPAAFILDECKKEDSADVLNRLVTIEIESEDGKEDI